MGTPGRVLLPFAVLMVALAGAPAPTRASPGSGARVLSLTRVVRGSRIGTPSSDRSDTPARRRTLRQRFKRMGKRLHPRLRQAGELFRPSLRWASDHLRLSRLPRARLLVDPADSAGARLDLVRSARHEINASVYILADDRVGRIQMAELRAAARAGRKVRLLIDGVGSTLPTAELAHLLDEGVEIGIYNRPTLRRLLGSPLQMSHRMHDKLLIGDGKRLVMGGRNLADGYFGIARGSSTDFDDIDVAVEGAPAKRANEYFMSLWKAPQVEHLERAELKVSSSEVTRYRGLLDHAERMAQRKGFDELRRRWRDQPVASLARAEFLHANPTTLGNPERQMQEHLLKFLDRATHEVEILTPYLLPDKALLAAVKRAHNRGVSVRFVTNSISRARGSEAVPQWAFESRLRALARAGAEVWEVGGPHELHAKTIVADGRRVWIGSYNMDPRSRDLQKEVSMVGHSKALAARLLARGHELRETGLLAAHGGHLTKAKLTGWSRVRNWLATGVIGPVLRGSGLYGQM